METENKDWKPEVGKTAWLMAGNTCMEVPVTKVFANFALVEACGRGDVEVFFELLHPSAEAALASIKVYGLDGKEVVVTRDSLKIDELVSESRILSPFELEFYNFCKQDSNIIASFGKSMIEKSANGGETVALQKICDIAFNMEIAPNPEGSSRLKAAQDRFASLAAGNEDPADPSQRDETDGRHRDPNFKGAQYPVVVDPREITTPIKVSNATNYISQRIDKRDEDGSHC